MRWFQIRKGALIGVGGAVVSEYGTEPAAVLARGGLLPVAAKQFFYPREDHCRVWEGLTPWFTRNPPFKVVVV